LIYNSFFYVLPFWLGIQFTFIYNKLTPPRFGNQTAINTNYENNASTSSHRFLQKKYVLNGAVIGLVLMYVTFHMVLLYLEKDIFLYIVYGVLYGVVMGAGAIMIFALRKYKGVSLELKYFIVCLLLIPMSRFYNPISAVCQGYMLGMMIEGIARWNWNSVLVNVEHSSSREKYLAWLSSPDWEDSLDQYTEQTDASDQGRSFILDDGFSPTQI